MLSGKSKQNNLSLMETYKCTVCGYLYDPSEGDTSGGIEPGVPFYDLPEDYVCPICGAGKDEFMVNS
jgi:rubredoxin